MQFAVVGSVAFHISAAAAIALFVAAPKPVDTVTTESIAVSLVNMQSISSNTTRTISNSATQDRSLAGAKVIEPTQFKPVDIKPLDPVSPTEPKAVTPTTVQPQKSQPTKPITTATVQMEAPTILATTQKSVVTTPPQILKPAKKTDEAPVLKTASLSPSKTDAILKPVEKFLPTPAPRPTTLKRTSKPTEFKEPVRKTQKKKTDTTKKPRVVKAGNGGKNNANSRAGAASSSKSVANYPGKIISKLRRALRSPSGARNKSGEAHVRFTVASNGQVSGVRLAKSSGNKTLDSAAIATVKRASPFPSIPPEAKRSNWAFTVPLFFQKR